MLRVGPERGEDLGALVLGELVERELVVVAHEVRPLAVLGDLRQRLERRRAAGVASPRASARYIAWLTTKLRTMCSSSPSSSPKNARCWSGAQVDLAHQDRVAAAAAHEAAQVAQEVVRVLERALRHPDRLEQERHRVDAEAGEALLQPVADDLRDLVADRGLATLRSGWWE